MKRMLSNLNEKGYEKPQFMTVAFYQKIGYKDCRCLVFDIPELEQPMEMFLIKQIYFVDDFLEFIEKRILGL